MFHVTTCKKASTEFKVTSAVIDHVNCSGAQGKGGREHAHCMSLERDFVTSNPTISGRVFISCVRSTTDVKLHRKTANRVKSSALRASVMEAVAGFHMLDSLMSFVAKDCGDSIMVVQVSFVRVVCPAVTLMSVLMAYG